ncbi:hypothetical protein T492DRAFT_941146 [Pavlovales sp. CCMP2436]|nr:hypothetical protein T492DRAFT_941146 [Pavlovales sp. CCMP2436]
MGDPAEDEGSEERDREYEGNRAPTPLEVKQWLEKTGRTQSSLARELGVGPPVISLWMTGKNSKRKQQLTTHQILTLMERDNNLPAGCTVPSSADNCPVPLPGAHMPSRAPPRVPPRAPIPRPPPTGGGMAGYPGGAPAQNGYSFVGGGQGPLIVDAVLVTDAEGSAAPIVPTPYPQSFADAPPGPDGTVGTGPLSAGGAAPGVVNAELMSELERGDCMPGSMAPPETDETDGLVAASDAPALEEQLLSDQHLLMAMAHQ